MATFNITKSPLPELSDLRIQRLELSDAYLDAYASVVEVQSRVSQQQTVATQQNQGDDVKEAETKLILIRVAGYLLLEFIEKAPIFGVEPSGILVDLLTSPLRRNAPVGQEDVVIKTGTLLRNTLLRMFRKVNPSYATPSMCPSRPLFDTLEDMIKDSMECSGADYKTMKEKSLARDGYRCIITGKFNIHSRENCRELQDNPRISALPLETAHIFNESIKQGIDPIIGDDSQGSLLNKTRTANGAWAMLEMFGFSNIADAFRDAAGVHQVWNLLTMEYDLNYFFDMLALWFDHTEKPHRYQVCTLGWGVENFIHDNFEGADRQIDGAPTFVEFNSTLEGVPPPDPVLLAIHAACARVTHMSGAAEYFDQMEQDAEEIPGVGYS